MESYAQDVHDYSIFLREAGLDDDTCDRLIDAGFDDFESLQLAEAGTISILGLSEPEEVYSKI